MLDVHVGRQRAGQLFKSESNPDICLFGYEPACAPDAAVSLSMPVVREHYASQSRVLHPVFDMNLPEGALADRLRREFSKVLPNFDALAMLRIVGQSQIGRLWFASTGASQADVPSENLNDLLTHDGAEGLFESLLSRYAVHSGISGAMPKVMVRDVALSDLGRVTHRGATHIVKAWTQEHPHLAENEFFCMRAALHAGLEVPRIALSHAGVFLVVSRFDLMDGVYLGFEDLCVLSGKTASQKYDGSYEGVAKRLSQFVSPQQVPLALSGLFKSLALSCAVRNGDAHLKNFGVLYPHAEATVRLAPTYDVVTTTVYHPADILALTLGGTKRWPNTRALLAFARGHCHLTDVQAKKILTDVAHGVRQAAQELEQHMARHPDFTPVGTAMLAQWHRGLATQAT